MATVRDNATSDRDGELLERIVTRHRIPPSFLEEIRAQDEDDEEDLSDSLDRFCDLLRRRQKKGLQNLILITGKPRMGKSTLAFRIGQKLDGDYDYHHVTFSASQLLDRSSELPAESTVQNDDSVLNMLVKAGGLSEEQQVLTQNLATIAYKHFTILLLAQDIGMYKSFAQYKMAEFWLHVEKRGEAKVFRVYQHEQHRISIGRYPYDRFDRRIAGDGCGPIPTLKFPNLDRNPEYRRYEQYKDEFLADWRRRKAQDPGDKLLACPNCGKLDWKLRTVIHMQSCPAAKPEPPTSQNERVNVTLRAAGIGGEGGAPPCPFCGREGLNEYNLRTHMGSCKARNEQEE